STKASARSSDRSHSWRSKPPSSVNTSTRTPHSRKARAATWPSPPLFPLPDTTTTRRPYVPPISCRTVHATARPARSMSTSTGVPPAIVRRSASPISAGVSTGRTGRPASPSADGDGHRHRHGVGVGEREVPGADAALVGEDGRLAVPRAGRRAAPTAHHLHVAELERAQPHAQRLHDRLLGAEPSREPGRGVVVAEGVGAFVVAEQTLGQVRPAPHREPEPS